jgi:hypothetical protein
MTNESAPLARYDASAVARVAVDEQQQTPPARDAAPTAAAPTPTESAPPARGN